MTWTTVSDLRQQTQKLWDKGLLLAALIRDQALFPKRLVLKSPTPNEITDNFEAVRAWSQSLRDTAHITLELKETRHRVFGSNQLPNAVWLDNAQNAIALIGKQKHAKRFNDLSAETAKLQPALMSWLIKRPLRALELADVWSQLLAVVTWLCAHPRPAIYIRQIDIPGVHSKFIEAHKGVLAELLDYCLPIEYIDNRFSSGSSQFCQRYGLQDKPQKIRFRILDAAYSPLPGISYPDISLDAESFSILNLPVKQVFITENEVNFLAFPQLKNSLVIFGAGYGFEALSAAKWLQHSQLHYWGDIDSHGFAILNQLRSYFPKVKSLLMDRATLMQFSEQWGYEDKPLHRDLGNLSAEELELYNELRDNRIRANLRLEQERIGFAWVLHRLQALS